MQRIGNPLNAVMAITLVIEFLTCFACANPATGDENESSKEVPVQIQYDVIYGSESEPMHRADLYRPKEKADGAKLPGVIFIHGGAWTAGDKRNDTQHAKRLASLGFVVMAVNYRLAPKHHYPAQLDDCRLAYQWFVSHADDLQVNVDTMGAWGYSAGGQLSALLASEPKDGLPRMKACVIGGAPCDLTAIPENSRILSGVFGGSRAQQPKIYSDASPVLHVSSDDPPVFLFHGAKDWLVPPESSEKMQRVLDEKGVIFEFYTVPNKGHLASFIDKEALEKSFVFLRKHLIAP